MKRLTVLLTAVVLSLFFSPISNVQAQPWPGIREGTEPGEETAAEKTAATGRVSDPLKSYNRLIFKFNDKAYFYVLKPVAKGYKAVLPEPVRISVKNAISNVAMPVRVVNCLLQGKLVYTASELARFAVNSTLGIAGLFDPAQSCLHLKKHEEDFGQTLGFYGLKEVFFIMWPLLGPSTVRDSIGAAGDYFTDPLVYVNPWIKTGIATFGVINNTSLSLGEYENFKGAAIDPYISLRNAYVQYRKKQIAE